MSNYFVLENRSTLRTEIVRIRICQNGFFHFMKKIGTHQYRRMSELEIVSIGNFPYRRKSELEIVRAGNHQSWKMSELEIVRIGNFRNWIFSESEIVRIRNCQNDVAAIFYMPNLAYRGQHYGSGVCSTSWEFFSQPRQKLGLLSSTAKQAIIQNWRKNIFLKMQIQLIVTTVKPIYKLSSF